MRAIPKLIAGACAVFMVLSMWASPALAEERKVRDPDVIKAIGTVTSVSGNTFHLQTPRRGELKVQHDAQTQWRNLVSDALTVGARVAVKGKLTGDVVHAEVLGAAPPKARRHAGKKRIAKRNALRGVVTAINDSGFTLQTRRGKIEVSYNDHTRFRGGSPGDIKKGITIAVVPVRPKESDRGSLRKATKVTAKVVGFPKSKGTHGPERSKGRPAGLKEEQATAAY